MDALLAFIHFIQASIPFFCCSGVEFFIIFWNSGPEAIYSTTNFFIGFSLALEINRPTEPHFRPGGDFVSLAADGFARKDKPNLAFRETPTGKVAGGYAVYNLNDVVCYLRCIGHCILGVFIVAYGEQEPLSQ